MRTSARIALLLSLVSSACDGTETGNPPLGAVQLALVAPDVPVPGALTADPVTGVRVDEVWVSIGRIKFVPGAQSCTEPGEADSDVREGLVAEVAAAENVFSLDLPPGDYCRVRVRLARADEAPAGAPDLLDQAVVVRGVRGDGVPFVIRSRGQPDVDLRSRGAPFALGGDDAALLLAFDARAWVAAIDLSAAELDDGVLVIDEDVNRELLPAFDRAIAEGLSLHDDRDRDHELSDDEAEPLADSR